MRRTTEVVLVTAVLIGAPAALGVIGRSGPASPPLPAGAQNVSESAAAAAQPFLEALGLTAGVCRWEGAGRSSIHCTLKPKGSCEIGIRSGTASCMQPGTGTTDYLFSEASAP